MKKSRASGMSVFIASPAKENLGILRSELARRGLEEGASMDDFLEWFPGVTREQVLTVLNRAEKSSTIVVISS